MKTSGGTILALDLGTSSVKALFARVVKSRKTPASLELLSLAQADLPAGAISAGAISDLPAVTDACERAIKSLEDMTSLRADQVVFGLSGEMLKMLTTSIHYRRATPDDPFSETEMEKILTKVQSTTRERATSDLSFETENPLAEVSLISSCLLSLTIDGERANNPIGFSGTDLDLEFYTVFAPKSQVSALEKIVADLELTLLAISANPFAASRALLGASESSPIASILLDLGAATTSLALLDASGLRAASSFALGASVATSDPSVWLAGVNVALSTFTDLDLLPSRLLLFGGGSALDSVQESLALEDWFSGLPFARRPIVSVLDPLSLPDFSCADTFDQSLLSPTFVNALGLLRVALDIEATSAPSRPLLGNLKKLLQK